MLGIQMTTTSVLSGRSFVFSFCRFFQEYVRTVRLTDDFWHHHLSFDQKKKICSCKRMVMDILSLIAF